jgi:hypothetical protein
MSIRSLVILVGLAALALFAPAAAQAQTATCPCSVFAAADAPDGDAVADAPLEVGMKFRSSEDGYITALRFYKQANNTGTHVGHLWTAGGQQLADVTFDGETASGWQSEQLSTPIAITAATTYVVSYHSSQGRYARTPGYFGSAVSRPPLTAPANADGGNGVYRYGASAFPNETFNATNYWVDVTFEQTVGDTRGPKVGSVTPAEGATAVSPSTAIKATFDEPVDPATVTAQTFTLQAAGGAAVAGAVSYDAPARTATFTPASALALGTTYTATVKGGAAGVADLAGNRLAADKTWSFSTPPGCPCTVFAPGDGPLGDAVVDSPIEVGMKFRSSEDGFITALRFYKQPNNTGVHVGHLWRATGQQLAEVTFDSETTSGWQEERLPQPIAITKDTIYITSYHASDGRYAYSPGALAFGADRPPLQAPADGVSGGNGVYRYGATSGFPDSSFNGTNYWADATFHRTQPPDTRAPKVSSTTPAAASSGAGPTTAVKATFDEPVDRLTVNASSMTLKNAAGNLVAASVTYDEATRTATLTPTATLAYGTTYTATVKSGNGGVTDVAGNRLAADKTWTFSTPAQCPCTVFAPTDAPDGNAVREDQSIEVGMKIRPSEDGYVTRLRFYKQPNNTGTHVGHLWSSSGALLATATFTAETASGWQEVDLANAIPVVKDATYIVSTFSASGYYAFQPGYFNTGVDRAPMHAPSAATSGGNGVYKFGASGFPDQTYNATNYWVDATFERTIPPDTRGPIVTETTPAAGATDVERGVQVTARFDEPLAPASVSGSTFTLRNAQGGAVAATVTYDAQTRTAKLAPAAPLATDATYTATLKGGPGGVTDAAGNPIAADKTWTFTIAGQSPSEGPGGPILVVTNPADKFSHYYAEILRGEGLNAFSLADGPVTPALLTGKQVVILATRSVTDAEVATLSSWVSAGGNLVAMRPDKKLAGLLGLADAGGTLSEGYLKVDTASAAGAGIDSQTLQYHGAADRYTSTGAATIARLYSNASTATTNPAVTLRNVGSSGGQTVAFTYDLARSVVYTRQGNPAWAGDKRDGLPPLSIRPNDLFYGAKAGDVQPDWVAPDKFAVPQADEQQRLLANLITQMNLDRAPLPRFGYLPRGEKATIVLTGDDHATGGTPAYFNRLKSSSPDGCSVADWECVRATSYVYPDTAMTNAQVAAYQNDGFEIALHLNTTCQDYTPASLEAALSSQLAAFAATWPSLRAPVSSRTHCIVWSDWAGTPVAERRHGIRFDTNYYYKGPAAWVRAPGLMTGSGFPQRFADLDGTMIDVYQSMTQVTDEMDATLPTTEQIHTLLDNALGSKAYYGVFNVILHSDEGDHARLNDLVAEAQDRGVPVVTSAQMLEWLDGRNGSSFGDITYSGGQLGFSLAKSPKARGLQAMVPASSATGPLSRLTRNGQPVSWNRRTLKGVEYAVFKGEAGAYSATYATDATPPAISGVTATADGEGNAIVKWETDEPSTSRVQYGRTTTLGTEVTATAPVTEHDVELTGLQPNTTYRYRVTSVDAAGNSATLPAPASAPASFTTPPGTLVDSRTSEFAAGTASGVHVGATLAGADGEIQLQAAVREEFEQSLLPLDWDATAWKAGGSVTVAGGALVADAARAVTTQLFDAPQTMEFTATFQPLNNQGVGFSRDLSDYPMAAFHTGVSGNAFQLYASSGTSPATDRTTPLPGVRLSVPHRFRIMWGPSSIAYYVDGGLVATHAVTIDRQMRPVVSDYGLFGANVKVHWLRQGGYSPSGTLTSRVLDGGPGANDWGSLTDQSTRPAGTGITYATRSGSTSAPDATWSAWQPVGAGGAIASPNSRFVQYRATLTGTATATPTLGRVAIGYTSGTGAPPADTTAPTAPTALSATTQGANVNVSWSAATDDVGVTEYRVYRSTSAGFTPGPSNWIGTVTSGTSYVDTAPAPGRHYYRVIAVDAAGNLGPASAADDAIVPDTTAPTVALTAPADGTTVSGTVALTATASDDVGVQGVRFTVDGNQIGAEDTTSPYSLSVDTQTLTDGSHTIRAMARDATGNSRTSDPRTLTVANATTGLRAAYGFEETSGTTVIDESGGNNGTISGATRTTSGRFGRALTFDGFNDWVTVAHDAAMNPGAAFTLEAWVNPTSISGSRLVAGKERTSGLAYGLYSRGGLSTPMARLFTSSDQTSSGPSQLPRNAWSHLAMTRGASTMRLYVNGVEVASRSVGSTLASSTGPFRIGGTTTASNWFRGRIDEIRFYDRQLSAAQIVADMNAAIRP